MTISEMLIDSLENHNDEVLGVTLELADSAARLEESLENLLFVALENGNDLADILPQFFTESADLIA